MKKHFLSLLRFLEAGLISYGQYSANIYWDYIDVYEESNVADMK